MATKRVTRSVGAGQGRVFVIRSVSSHARHNAIAYLALFVALGGTSYAAIKLPANSVGTKQIKKSAVTSAKIKNGSITSTKIKNGSIKTADLSPGTLKAGGVGPAGPKGDKGDRGLNSAASRQVPNVNDIACGEDVVVGSLPVNVTEPSRVWTHAHGAIANDNSDSTEAGLWLRLRDAANTTTLAVSVPAWEGHLDALTVSPLTTGGLLLAGTNPEAPGGPYTAAPGTYVLELVARSQGGACAATKPDFGWNQGAAIGYVLVGSA
jgi:hypothetical protein